MYHSLPGRQSFCVRSKMHSIMNLYDNNDFGLCWSNSAYFCCTLSVYCKCCLPEYDWVGLFCNYYSSCNIIIPHSLCYRHLQVILSVQLLVDSSIPYNEEIKHKTHYLLGVIGFLSLMGLSRKKKYDNERITVITYYL